MHVLSDEVFASPLLLDTDAQLRFPHLLSTALFCDSRAMDSNSPPTVTTCLTAVLIYSTITTACLIIMPPVYLAMSILSATKIFIFALIRISIRLPFRLPRFAFALCVFFARLSGATALFYSYRRGRGGDDGSAQYPFEGRSSTCYWTSLDEAVRNLVEGTFIATPPRPKPVGPTTFPQFSRLPTEIRLQIWREAALVPRAVLLRPRHRPCKSRIIRSWRCCNPVPALLHVNSEARGVTLASRYPIAYGGVRGTPTRAYVNLRFDYIAFPQVGPHSFFWATWADPHLLAKVRHLVLPAHQIATASSLWSHFRRLEDVVLVDWGFWVTYLSARNANDFTTWWKNNSGKVRHYRTKWKKGSLIARSGDEECVLVDPSGRL